MAIKYRQIFFKNTFSDCQDMFDTSSFFQLLDEYFDINEFIPSFLPMLLSASWKEKDLSPNRFLSALFLQKFFSIPTDSLLISFPLQRTPGFL